MKILKNFSLFLFCILSITSLAQEDTKEKKNDITPAQVFESSGEVTIANKTIAYNTEAGQLRITDNDGMAMANFGFTAYTASNGMDSVNRPIVFAFNGGPGSASFWLHMGVLGPKRIAIDDPNYTDPAPFSIVKNEYSILDIADLVMIDPVGTGISVPTGKYEFKDFWGVDQDIQSISNFIRQYLLKNGRMNSPKYLLGESYGTFRNAGLMDYMQGRGIPFNGVIMVSAVFDIRQLMFPVGDDLPYIVHFPTYAATSWYHGLVQNAGDDLFAFLDRVRDFTKNKYAPALFAGDQLSEQERSDVAAELSQFTGISIDYWLKANLRVTASEYFAEAMRDEGQLVGRLDSRFHGVNQDLLSQNGDHDPQSMAISGPYITGFLDYFYGELGVSTDLKYMTTAGQREGFKWDWSHRGNNGWGTQTAISTSGDLARALARNPKTKVLILNGIYDIATVFYGVEYTIDHLGLPAKIKKNIIMKYYEAGHMMYTHQPSLVKFKKDVAEFIEDTH